MTFRKNNKTISSAIVYILLTLTSSVSIASPIEDKAITASVREALKAEQDIPEQHIEIVTTDKIVALRGSVDTKLQANKAIEVAFSVDNVLDVTDHLKVKDSSSVITDSLLTAKAKGKIRHLWINKKIAADYDLHVETTNQVVHIFGEVSSTADISTITESIKAINNVKSVKTNIRLKN